MLSAGFSRVFDSALFMIEKRCSNWTKKVVFNVTWKAQVLIIAAIPKPIG